MIEVRDVSVVYRSKAKDVIGLGRTSFTASPGERVAIMGQSGSGKSTLLSVLGGITKATSGDYVFQGCSVGNLPSSELAGFRGSKIGFVFQNFFLLPHLTLLENVLLPVQHLRKDKQDARQRAEQLLAQVGIADLRDRFPGEVSGGQAQRAAIARALMRNPRMILADEPTGSLDSESTSSVLRLLNSLSESGTTVIVATHDAKVAKELGRTITVERANASMAPAEI